MTSNDNELAVVVKDLHKTFRLPSERHSGVKQALLSIFKKSKKNKSFETQKVLNDISFEIKKGEFYGIVGRNGSGKSTLLKLLAGIYTPDKGLVHINGSLTPFIELGVGFNPELTGRENVYLNGALLGFDHKQMDKMYKDIVSFAELDKFMDQKLKNYSSGMQVRLAFSIAIRAKSDILLIDEVLAVGDQAFQRKCFEYFRELKREKKTVILVTHDMSAVKEYCTRAMLIDRSELIAIGTPADIADEYSIRMVSDTSNHSESRLISNITVRNYLGEQIVKGNVLDLLISYTSNTTEEYFIAYSLKRDGRSIAESNSQYTKGLDFSKGKQEVRLTIDVTNLTSGEYEIDVAFYKRSNADIIAYRNSALIQILTHKTEKYSGYFVAPSTWSKK